jgi:hypothetical protein
MYYSALHPVFFGKTAGKSQFLSKTLPTRPQPSSGTNTLQSTMGNSGLQNLRNGMNVV